MIDNFELIKSLFYFNEAGELKSRNPKWVVDIDDISMMNAIADKLFELYAEALKEVGYDYIYAQIPTKQGIHIVVNILNLKKYNESIKDLFKDLWTLQGAGEQSPTCRYST